RLAEEQVDLGPQHHLLVEERHADARLGAWVHLACSGGQHSKNLATTSLALLRSSATSSAGASASHGPGLARRSSSFSVSMAWSTSSSGTASPARVTDSSSALCTTEPRAVRAVHSKSVSARKWAS